MDLIDNINRLLGDDLKQALKPGARMKVAASCFSMYAFEALKAELEKIDELNFIFTAPAFVADEVTDKIRRERREFHIPKLDRERSLYGSEFEIQLRNKLNQRAIAKECADWLRRRYTVTCCPSGLIWLPTARMMLGRRVASRDATMADTPLATMAVWLGPSSAVVMP